MQLSWKRILALIGFFLLIVFFAYLIFILFFQGAPSSTPTTTTTAPPSSGGLPSVGPGQPGTTSTLGSGLPLTSPPGTTTNPSPVASGGVTDTTLLVPNATADATTDGSSVLYYQPSDGKFYRTTADGKTETLSDEVFHNVSTVTWSPNRSEAVLEYPDGSNIVYNFQTNKQVTLPQHWDNFSFDPSGDQLAFKSEGIDASSRWIGVSSVDGGQAQAIQPLGDNGASVDVNWSPNKQIIATYHEATAADQQEIYFVGLNGENFRSITAPGRALQTQWTPDGSRLLFSVSSADNAYKPMLWVVDASGDAIGQDRHSLGLDTWADKCTFQNSSNLICAVPQSLPEGSGLAPGLADNTPDDLYRVNLDTGEKSLLAKPTTSLTANNLFVSQDGRTVFVQDGPTGHIYTIAL